MVRLIALGYERPTLPVRTNDALLNLIKDEMFAIEREKLSGTLPLDEYTPIKAGLDALLRRALRTQEHIERE
jgi:hypothetical protein